MAEDETERAAEAAKRAKRQEGGPPPAGPHADPRLTNEDATPGAGSLPDPTDGEADPAAG